MEFRSQIIDSLIIFYRSAEHLEQKLKQFDWTFSTDYAGTLSPNAQVELTEERIDLEMLKQKDKILFYHEMMLYEDELHDNGISSLTIKIVSLIIYYIHFSHVFYRI